LLSSSYQQLCYRENKIARVKGRRTYFFLGVRALTSVCSLPPVTLIS